MTNPPKPPDQPPAAGQTQSGTGNIQIGAGSSMQDVFTGDKTVYAGGLAPDQVAALFRDLYSRVDAKPELSPVDKEDLKGELKQVEAETAKGDQADETALARHLRFIGRMAPDILQVATATLSNPAAGVALVIRKVAERAQKDAGGTGQKV